MSSSTQEINMDPERWAQIKPVFFAAIELPSTKRAAFIRSHCRGDEALVSEIESLIAAHDRDHSFIESPAIEGSPQQPERDAAAEAGKLIGAYRVIRELGSGGMGSVYLAVRADRQFEKQVAIKLIRTELGGDFVIQRFISERQILARLEHPNIARLMDGGTTADELPYLVMEYVEGKPITDYCAEKALTAEDRLKLFREVCAAVHHAHQNLIVHRDIKPGNILVTAEGEPKLLDFGIAKLLSPGVDSDNTTTLFGRVMTPDYASPEQAKGEPITTSSDVYSLGVLLYELLTGSRPYRISTNSLLEIARVICEQEPLKPSTAVQVQSTDSSSAAKSTKPQGGLCRTAVEASKLRRQLEGDLDNIVLKAMCKEPGRRYASAQELSDDIRRHLDGLPVIARPATLEYRAGKFVRRHKTAVASAAIILLTLVGAVVGIARQAVIANRQRARAEKRFNEVRSLANSFMFKFHDSIANLPGSTEARQLVVSESLEYLNSLADEASGDPSLQSELATAYFRLGDIQGFSNSGNLGDKKGALESHRKALELRQSVTASRPDPESRLQLAASHQRVASLLGETDDRNAAMEHYHQAIAISEPLLQSADHRLSARRHLAATYHGLGQFLRETDATAALEYFKKAIIEHEACLTADPKDLPVRRNLSLLYKNVGAAIHMNGDYDTALTFYAKALALDQADSAANPNGTEARMALSFSYGSIGSALVDNGDLAGGLENYRKALDLRLSVWTADPKNVFARNAVSRAYDRIGGILFRMGDHAGAISTYKKMTEIPGSAGALPQQAAVYAKMADSFSNLVSGLGHTPQSEKANLRSAVSWYRRSLDALVGAGGQLSEAQQKEKERISRQIARCEASLRTLGHAEAKPGTSLSAPH